MAKKSRSLEDIYFYKTLEYLKAKATEIVADARSRRQSENPGEHLANITGVQDDSYGALIFYNGGLVYTLRTTHGKDVSRVKYAIESDEYTPGRHKGYAKWGIPDGTGPEWAEMLRKEIKAGKWGKIPTKGFCLVIFNAAFYSVVHEKKQGYKVISMIGDKMEQLKSEFKGATIQWHIGS